MAKRVIVVGATGSIGRQTLDVLGAHPELFSVVALCSHTDEAGLLRAASRFPGASLALSGAEAGDPRIAHSGAAALERLLGEMQADIVVNGASGAAGLRISVAALEGGKDLALANKESVVMGWSVLRQAAAGSGRLIVPVDSEHAALFQLLHRVGHDQVEELIITASGGAFRNRSLEELPRVSPDEAAAHPNWSMGRKITIDSATMANKGLEVIEAARLYDQDSKRITVLIHPQSLVHAAVRTRDGSLYAQLSEPDMRVPIQNALTWPETLPCPFGRLDLAGRSLEFQRPDPRRYPLLGLAYRALEAGEGSTIVYNAADEIAVAAFEAGELSFTGIAEIVERALDRPWSSRIEDLRGILEIDTLAREYALRVLREHTAC